MDKNNPFALHLHSSPAFASAVRLPFPSVEWVEKKIVPSRKIDKQGSRNEGQGQNVEKGGKKVRGHNTPVRTLLDSSSFLFGRRATLTASIFIRLAERTNEFIAQCIN